MDTNDQKKIQDGLAEIVHEEGFETNNAKVVSGAARLIADLINAIDPGAQASVGNPNRMERPMLNIDIYTHISIFSYNEDAIISPKRRDLWHFRNVGVSGWTYVHNHVREPMSRASILSHIDYHHDRPDVHIHFHQGDTYVDGAAVYRDWLNSEPIDLEDSNANGTD
tara:strand:- start:2488 stop:2988 length:501 start_codon:yes stop_codon:yes gene_type:complete